MSGQSAYLYRAVDQHGQVIDVLLSIRRDLAAVRRFFTRAMRAGAIPAEVTTDRAPAYPRVLDELIPSAPAHSRAVREQPGRSRPRTAQSPAPADARTEELPVSADPRRRSRVRPEPAPRPLRHRHRRLRAPQATEGLRRPRNHHLTSGVPERSCSDSLQERLNATVPARRCHCGHATPRPCRPQRPT